jgi:hypothetical protein
MEVEFIRRNGSIVQSQEAVDGSVIKYVAKFDSNPGSEALEEEFADIIISRADRKYYITLPKDQIILNAGKIVKLYEMGAFKMVVGVSENGRMETLAVLADENTGLGAFEYIGSE